MLLQFRGYSTGYKIDRQKFIRFACEHTANQKLKNKLQDVSHIEKLLEEKKIWKSNLHQWHHVCDEEMWRWTYHWIHYTCNLITYTCLFIIMITENFVVKLNIWNRSRHLSRWWTILLISFPFLRCQRANEREKTNHKCDCVWCSSNGRNVHVNLDLLTR